MDKESSDEDLLKRYMDVCGLAIEQNRGRFPYSQIFESIATVSPRDVNICVIDNHPVTTFSLRRTQDGDWSTSRLRAQPEGEPPIWIVKREYLQQVIDASDDFVANPAKLDWDWLSYATEGDPSLHGNSEEHAEHA